MRVIAVINQKGGVGKTTTAINLGAYLAKSNRRVLIIDADPQGNATSGLGLAKNDIQTLGDVLLNNADFNKIVQKTAIKNLKIAPANASLASAEVELVNREQREMVLSHNIPANYDYILIDCPPALGLLTVNALTASDSVIIPVQAEYYALEGLSQLLQLVQHVKHALNAKLEILGVVLTMYDKRNSLAREVANELKTHFGDKLFTTAIPRNVRLAEAPSYGRPVSEHDSWSKGARAYKKLASEVEKHA